MQINLLLQDPDFICGLVTVHGIQIRETSPELNEEIQGGGELRKANPHPENVKNSVRDLLRRGGFSPSGRNKPANEYLANAARENRFPIINNVVDVCNILSLDCGLPMCVQDLDVSGTDLVIRYGTPLLELIPGTHFTVYNEPQQPVRVAMDWFKTHLAVDTINNSSSIAECT